MKERVEFDAHNVVNKATNVAFRTKSGEKGPVYCREGDQGVLFDSHLVPRGAVLDRLICAG